MAVDGDALFGQIEKPITAKHVMQFVPALEKGRRRIGYRSRLRFSRLRFSRLGSVCSGSTLTDRADREASNFARGPVYTGTESRRGVPPSARNRAGERSITVSNELGRVIGASLVQPSVKFASNYFCNGSTVRSTGLSVSAVTADTGSPAYSAVPRTVRDGDACADGLQFRLEELPALPDAQSWTGFVRVVPVGIDTGDPILTGDEGDRPRERVQLRCGRHVVLPEV